MKTQPGATQALAGAAERTATSNNAHDAKGSYRHPALGLGNIGPRMPTEFSTRNRLAWRVVGQSRVEVSLRTLRDSRALLFLFRIRSEKVQNRSKFNSQVGVVLYFGLIGSDSRFSYMGVKVEPCCF